MIKRALADFASAPIANTAALACMAAAATCAWRNDMYGTLLFSILCNQWLDKPKP